MSKNTILFKVFLPLFLSVFWGCRFCIFILDLVTLCSGVCFLFCFVKYRGPDMWMRMVYAGCMESWAGVLSPRNLTCLSLTAVPDGKTFIKCVCNITLKNSINKNVIVGAWSWCYSCIISFSLTNISDSLLTTLPTLGSNNMLQLTLGCCFKAFLILNMYKQWMIWPKGIMSWC